MQLFYISGIQYAASQVCILFKRFCTHCVHSKHIFWFGRNLEVYNERRGGVGNFFKSQFLKMFKKKIIFCLSNISSLKRNEGNISEFLQILALLFFFFFFFPFDSFEINQNWRMEDSVIKTMRCSKLSIIVLGQKNAIQSFVRWKQ